MKQPSRIGAGCAFALTAGLPLAGVALLMIPSVKPEPSSFWFELMAFPIAAGLAGAIAAPLLVRFGRMGATFAGAILSFCVAMLVDLGSIMAEIRGPGYAEQLGMAIAKTLYYAWFIAIPFHAVQGLMGAIAGYVVAVDGGAPPETAPSQGNRPPARRLESSARQARTRTASSSFYLVRLWRGEEPLAATYWLWGVAVICTSPFVLGFFHSKALLFVFLPYPMLIMIAIWRSAGNYDGEPALPALARLSSMMATAFLYVLFLFFGGADLLIRTFDSLR